MAETVRDEINQLAGSIRALERQLEVALASREPVTLKGYVVLNGVFRSPRPKASREYALL